MMENRRLIVPNKILIGEIKRSVREGHSALFLVKGYSMRLFLENERDKVKIEPVKPEAVSVGNVVLAEISRDQYVLHRVIAREGRRLTLMGDGNIKGTETCQDTDVVGIATAFYRKGRTTPDLASGRKWRIYSRVWLFLRPCRRIILAVYRRLPFRL